MVSTEVHAQGGGDDTGMAFHQQKLESKVLMAYLLFLPAGCMATDAHTYIALLVLLYFWPQGRQLLPGSVYSEMCKQTSTLQSPALVNPKLSLQDAALPALAPAVSLLAMPVGGIEAQ